MSRKQKRLERLRLHPQDWTLEELIVIATEHGFDVRQGKGSHAVFTSPNGASQSIPAHRPVKAIYVKFLLALLEEVVNEAQE